ncbi:4a-hydroxytetrahydrobiopterin dehydratase [Promicromonospora umidemergens]|uniref:Putative pterin-4-alpha-carbinolamine dehydratase n=1 Tax=Promicromonospora umidemergens TaxID=629679 RepID=A0ABP8YFS0_9MICO|nr:VOC family protein [Promicromonospora umidemergens]MCP2285295.1 4a-hydroxytetrahydrobiopterin dehydratase [Promicromonospora umidemergens]
MTDAITAAEFTADAGTGDWRVVRRSALARFATGSFTRGVRLVNRIGALAEAANHHPDVDLRYGAVTVRTWSHDVGGLSARDVALARDISMAARELDVAADTVGVRDVTIGIDAIVGPEVQPFWQALLGYDAQPDSEGNDAAPRLSDPDGRLPVIWFQQSDERREQRGRIHLDVWVPYDEAEQRVAAVVAAGGRLVTDEYAPSWWVLADAEGNEACVCTWQGEF